VKRIEWDGSLRTGNETVDRQHQTLIGIFNEFADACDLECDRVITADVLMRLSDYVSMHFADEESLMVRYDYPQARQTAINPSTGSSQSRLANSFSRIAPAPERTSSSSRNSSRNGSLSISWRLT
jgi:hypothetical protein